jgi:hypothetical protein
MFTLVLELSDSPNFLYFLCSPIFLGRDRPAYVTSQYRSFNHMTMIVDQSFGSIGAGEDDLLTHIRMSNEYTYFYFYLAYIHVSIAMKWQRWVAESQLAEAGSSTQCLAAARRTKPIASPLCCFLCRPEMISAVDH